MLAATRSHTISARISHNRQGADISTPHAACFATLLFKDSNLTHMRRAWEEDIAMVRRAALPCDADTRSADRTFFVAACAVAQIQLWATKMLNLTRLPILIMHANVDARALLQPVDPGSRLQYWPVHLLRGGYWKKWPHYRYMHTKLQAWTLPCTQAAFVDYDMIPLRNLDNVFEKCGPQASLCAVRDTVTPKRPGLRCLNAGLMVVRTNVTTFRMLADQAEVEAQQGRKRMLAEQGFLSDHFPDWKELPVGYNLPEWIALRRNTTAWLKRNDSYLFHRKLVDVKWRFADVLGVKNEMAALLKQPRECRAVNLSGSLLPGRQCGVALVPSVE